MINEEAINVLKDSKITYIAPNEKKLAKEALEMAISALSTKVECGMISQREFGVFGELDGKTAFRKGEYIYTVEHLINQLGAETHGIVFIPDSYITNTKEKIDK